MLNETQTQFNSEDTPVIPDADTETENSADSSTEEETNTDSTHSSDGENSDANENNDGAEDKGDELHKHPRWKEREDDWKERFNDQEKRHADEMRQLREDLDAKLEKALNKSDDSNIENIEVPSWFGGDETQFKAFSEYISTLTKGAKEEAIREMKEKTASEDTAVKEATQYLNDQIAEIEKGGEKVDRDALLKFVLDNELVDTKGRWNYKAGFRLMQAEQNKANKDKTKIDEKKKIAAASTSENRAETKAPAIPTTDTFNDPSKRPW